MVIMEASQSQRHSSPPATKLVSPVSTTSRQSAAEYQSPRDEPRPGAAPRPSTLQWPLPPAGVRPILDMDSLPVRPRQVEAPSPVGQPPSAGSASYTRRLQPLPPLPPLPLPTPPGSSGHHSSHNRYLDMLLRLDKIPRLHNILATFFNWILLAGFIFFSGAFTVYDSAQFAAFLSVALVLSYAGLLGIVWLSIRWRNNYVWLLNKIYLPGALNGLAGLLTSIVSVYTQQYGHWSPCAKAVVTMESLLAVVCALLFVFYNNLLLRRLKRRHEPERGLEDRRCRWFGKVERVAKERPFAPGSIV